jgi:class 3 adenylate cyclase
MVASLTPERGEYLGARMPFKEELQEAVAKILREQWSLRDGDIVPDPEDLELGNDAVKLDAVVLYADMAGSTELVDSKIPSFAAEVYKTYMACAARIIKNAGGSITAYDGDRIMGVFINNSKNTIAAKAALQINWAVSSLINPALKKQYGNEEYQLKHCIGVDASSIFACRIGVRNDNDIVWVGRAANYAAKLSSLNDGDPVFITGDVFDNLHASSKFGGNPKELMWKKRSWTQMNDMRIYSSGWTWSV